MPEVTQTASSDGGGALISAPTLDTLFDSSCLLPVEVLGAGPLCLTVHRCTTVILTKWVGYNTSTFVKLLLEQRRVSSAKMPVQEFVRILTIRFSQTQSPFSSLRMRKYCIKLQLVASYSSKLHPKQFTMLHTRTRNAVIELIVSSRHHHCHEHDDI